MARLARLTRPALPVLAIASIVAACADEEPTLTSPPDPQLATGLAAQRIVVTTTEDTEDCDPSPGECSLRGAIEAANADPEGGPYTIVLEAGETYTLTETGSLRVRVGLVIEGNGATIEQDDSNVFNSVFLVTIDGPPELALNDVTVSGGGYSGIRVLGSVLTLSHSTVSDNHNSADISDGSGGGIRATGSTITLIDSRVIDNTAEGSESAFRDGRGGGIYSRDSEVTLTNSVVSGNHVRAGGETAFGGGIYSEGGQLTLDHSTVSDNDAEEARGGGIWGGGDSDLALTNSVVSGNIAASGGGVFLSSGTLTVEKSTLSENFAGSGGAIRQVGGTLTAVNTTLSGNFGVLVGGGAISKSGGDLALINGTVTGNDSRVVFFAGDAITGEVTLSNTIVADQEVGSDCGASITSLGHNLDSDGSCGLTAPGDQPNANANLGLLADNGGPTPTHELLEGSDALDNGDDAVCAADPVNGVDQRGIERHQGPACDIGAFELEVEPIPTILTAEPALLQLGGGLLGLRIRLLDLSGRLVRADSGDPIAGETVTMTVAGLGGGSQEVCSAVTDGDGVATCSGGLGSLLGLVLSGYTATFAGTWQYEPSSADAPLIRVDVGG